MWRFRGLTPVGMSARARMSRSGIPLVPRAAPPLWPRVRRNENGRLLKIALA